MENYKLTIVKNTLRDEYQQELSAYNNLWTYDQRNASFPQQFNEEVLRVDLTQEQFNAVRKEVLTVF